MEVAIMAAQDYIQPLAYSFNSFAQATGISSTNLRADAKAGLLKIKQRGRRRIILKDDGIQYLNNLSAGTVGSV